VLPPAAGVPVEEVAAGVAPVEDEDEEVPLTAAPAPVSLELELLEPAAAAAVEEEEEDEEPDDEFASTAGRKIRAKTNNTNERRILEKRSEEKITDRSRTED
jgi:hypothetical protein